MLMSAETKRRERECPICGTKFLAAWPSSKTRFCSRPCQNKNQSKLNTGRVHSIETREKMSRSRQTWRVTHPEREMRRRESARIATQTDEYISGALARYKAMQENGTGICSDKVRDFTANAAKWVMKRARAAMEAETEFVEVWTRAQERLRREMPYDAPLGTPDHFEYLKKLGKAVTADPEVRAVQDGFMSAAIARFYAEWREKVNQEAKAFPVEDFRMKGGSDERGA